MDTSAVLIATLGTEQQVVTTGLDLLLKQRENIQSVVVIHTTGNPQIQNAAHMLEKEFAHHPAYKMIDFKLTSIMDQNRTAMDDVHSPEEIKAAYRTIYQTIRQIKAASPPSPKIHFLIAGGRKTLPIFGMAAAQLLFNEHDKIWHLYSAGDYLESKRLHPTTKDIAELIEIPNIHWSTTAPILIDIEQYEDPYQALDQQKNLRLPEKIEIARKFTEEILSPSEERVVESLVRESLKIDQLAERLYLSEKTIDSHLRKAYQEAKVHWGLEEVSAKHIISLLSLYYAIKKPEEGKS
ncbi:hypothetical protein KQH40_01350 [bacterium]|nr:hypothetical protein [bacterium]